MEDAWKDKVEGPPVSLPEEDKDEGTLGVVGWHHRSAKPGLVPVGAP